MPGLSTSVAGSADAFEEALDLDHDAGQVEGERTRPDDARLDHPAGRPLVVDHAAVAWTKFAIEYPGIFGEFHGNQNVGVLKDSLLWDHERFRHFIDEVGLDIPSIVPTYRNGLGAGITLRCATVDAFRNPDSIATDGEPKCNDSLTPPRFDAIAGAVGALLAIGYALPPKTTPPTNSSTQLPTTRLATAIRLANAKA